MPARPLFTEARATLALAVPMIIGQVGQILMGITDSVMIGRVGTTPLAASAFAGGIVTVFLIVGFGLLLGIPVLISRAHGAGRPDECAEWLRHGLALALVAGVLSGLILVAGTPLLDHLGQPREVVRVARPYFVIMAVSLVPALAFQALRQFAESLGRPWEPMRIMLAGVVLNAVFNWVLIYGRLGFPALGLVGAGVATLLARGVCWAWIAWWLRGDRELRPAWPVRWRASWKGSRFRDILALGGPVSVQLVFETGAFAGAAIMMGWMGKTALAAHQIALSCASFTFMFPLGLASAVSMRLGKAIGEGRTGALRRIGFGALGMGTIMMALFAVGFIVGGRFLAAQFVDDPKVVALAARLLVVAGVFQIFDGGQVIGAGALRGLADVRVPMVITFLAYWVLALPIGYLFGVHRFGPLGIWGGLAVGLACAALMLAGRFYRRTAAEM